MAKNDFKQIESEMISLELNLQNTNPDQLLNDNLKIYGKIDQIQQSLYHLETLNLNKNQKNLLKVKIIKINLVHQNQGKI